jgi:(R)-2-hydroxyacyl-CoA dehydratese activating ATPase
LDSSERTVLGLDIGSRTVDALWLRGRASEPPGSWVVADSVIVDSGPDPAAAAARLAAGGEHDIVVATGYGRRAAAERLEAQVITEIRAYALGAGRLHRECRAVLDVGGQDTKAIALDDRARVTDFEMNDRCAAGTGKFLEVMAAALGLGLDDLGPAALRAATGVRISSMCTVFAESEVVGLLHRGEDRDRIALGLHDAVARRVLAMLKRAGAAGPLLFAGGVARNPAMQRLVTDGYGDIVVVADRPQLVGALGAALHGAIGDGADGEEPG